MLLRTIAAAALLAGLAGCSAAPNLFHKVEGGEIAKPRAALPGVERPYPNLASVPARPTPPDQKALDAISQSLIADRENARHLTMPAPADPSLPSASPALFGVGTVPPPPPAGSPSATLAAVENPPAPPTTPAPPAPPVAAAPGASNSGATPPPAAPPQVPAGPPAPPRLASVGPPVGAPAAAPQPIKTPVRPPPVVAKAAPPPVPPPAANAANTVVVAFAPTSAVLPADSAAALRALAKRRGAHTVAVIGYGDTAEADPAAQSRAVSLGLQRAEAIAQALAADGVPENAVRLDALANGRGGSARLVE